MDAEFTIASPAFIDGPRRITELVICRSNFDCANCASTTLNSLLRKEFARLTQGGCKNKRSATTTYRGSNDSQHDCLCQRRKRHAQFRG